MSHEFDSGWLNQPAWHGLGKVRGQMGPGGEIMPDRQPADMKELRRWAGLEWEPAEVPLYVCTTGSCAPDMDMEFPANFKQIEGWQAITRSDTGRFLSCARDSRGIITNSEHLEFAEAVMGQIADGGVETEALISLKGGAQVVFVCRLTDAFKIPGDPSPHHTYATFGNAHDGSAAFTAFPSNIRVVCMNTWSAAKAGAEDLFGQGIVIRHTRSASERVEQAKRILTGMADERGRYLELMEELVGYRLDKVLLERFVVDFIPSPPETLISDRVANNIEEAREAVRAILYGKTGTVPAEVQGTGYACLMAATEYLDHARKARSAETRFRRTMLRQEPLKDRALKLVRDLVTVGGETGGGLVAVPPAFEVVGGYVGDPGDDDLYVGDPGDDDLGDLGGLGELDL